MSTLIFLFLLPLAIVFWFVSLSYAIAWYEFGNRDPKALAERFAPDRLALALQLLALETGALFVTLLLYPFGWMRYRLDGNASLHPTPVLLLHGMFHNRACWLATEYRLRRAGFGAILSINLPPWEDLESHVDRVAAAVAELRQETGSEQVDIVGHSMGGIVARSYLHRYGAAARVRRCVLIATPNSGSKLAPFALSRQALSVLPGSAFLQELAAAPWPAGTDLRVILSRHDNIVQPWENARLEGAPTLELDGIGHNTLLYHPGVADTVLKILAEPAP